YPHVKIHLDEGSSLDMIRSLIDLKNEVALISKTEDNADVRFIPFSQEELVLITAPDHSLARRKSVLA
ncbi:MAG: LysR family transcriptional regulator, partial [Desulfobacterales bacterium]|nr:LysR family transcriptional regulator [Desulfobacterales bacterium]